MMSKYAELKRKGQTAPADGIFYAFSDEQFAKGLAKCGYTQADVDSICDYDYKNLEKWKEEAREKYGVEIK